MSCRIIGRNVEDALLAALEGKARGGGCKRLLGKYAETKKNGLVADFYRQRGFVASDSPGTFIRDLATSKALEWPPHIELKDGKPA
jgi:predicted enzyme involved in methoxymalonyl-ACP biosynthesis